MINIAIAGAGSIARTHIQAFLRFPDLCRIVAVCNYRKEKAERLIEELSLSAKAYSSIQEAAVENDITAVSICTPPQHHAETAIWAMQAGMHVLTEKPMAGCLEDCDRMIEASEKYGRILSVIFQLRFTTPVYRLHKLLTEQRFGSLKYACVNSMWFRGVHYHDIGWRGQWSGEGGGVLTAQAIHHLDLLLYMSGMPQKVTASMTNLAHTNTQCEDAISLVLESGSFFGSFNASLVSHGEKQSLDFYTDQAAFSLPWSVTASTPMANGYPEKDDALIREIMSAYESIPPLEYEHHSGQALDFLKAIEENREPLVTGRDGRNVLEVITAAYKSASVGLPITLPLEEGDVLRTSEGKGAMLPHFHEKSFSVDSLGDGAITFARAF